MFSEINQTAILFLLRYYIIAFPIHKGAAETINSSYDQHIERHRWGGVCFINISDKEYSVLHDLASK